MWQIFRKVSQAMSCTPGWRSCINSKSLLTTVLRNFQWFRKKVGYWPTTYLHKNALGIRGVYLVKIKLACQLSHSSCVKRRNLLVSEILEDGEMQSSQEFLVKWNKMAWSTSYYNTQIPKSVGATWRWIDRTQIVSLGKMNSRDTRLWISGHPVSRG